MRAAQHDGHGPGRGASNARPSVLASRRRGPAAGAGQAMLEALPGIGAVIARRIVEGRPYRSVKELERVKGIGKKRLEEIRSFVTAE